MILIGISGKKGVGKDLFASFLKHRYGFINLPFAQELKEAVRRDFNLTKEHTDGALKEKDTSFVKSPILEGMPHLGAWTPREIMIAYGQFFRQFDKNYWVKKTFDKIQQVRTFQNYGSDVRVCISDVRFKNEAEYIKNQGGILVRLERKPELNIYKFPSDDISETDLDNYGGFDAIISADNNIVPDNLSDFADDVMKYVLQGYPA